MSENNYLKENLENINRRIEAAAEKSGRRGSDIKLVAVSKTIEPERIMGALENGVLDLGENRVQELCEKYDIIKGEVKWHLIGHLQTNKVKYIIEKVSLIHSVDSIELAQEIQKNAAKVNKVMDILIQVNVSGEESKFGIDPGEVEGFIHTIKTFPNIKVRGLMTIAPNSGDNNEIRKVFKGLYKIFIDIKQENTDNVHMDTLSMGMSNDFEIAIEEGANLVRIGSAIFGKRL